MKLSQGNLLESQAEALVNTVNTVGVMGKGIALMFKEKFPLNYKLYKQACSQKAVQVGQVFVTRNPEFSNPKWIINFPTKEHWRGKTKLAWIESGMDDLVRVVRELEITSIAIPPLGCGNGGLDWDQVRPIILSKLQSIGAVDIEVFEPTRRYANVSKRSGVEELTPSRALIAELVRSYWVMGLACSILEVQKLAWFLSRSIGLTAGAEDPLRLDFKAHKYGPYSDRLRHVLNDMDGSYLGCERRIPDARPSDVIWFQNDREQVLSEYIRVECKPWQPALQRTLALIDGFESPLGLETLSTVDWLVNREDNRGSRSNEVDVRSWSYPSKSAGARKAAIMDQRAVAIAHEQLISAGFARA